MFRHLCIVAVAASTITVSAQTLPAAQPSQRVAPPTNDASDALPEGQLLVMLDSYAMFQAQQQLCSATAGIEPAEQGSEQRAGVRGSRRARREAPASSGHARALRLSAQRSAELLERIARLARAALDALPQLAAERAGELGLLAHDALDHGACDLPDQVRELNAL